MSAGPPQGFTRFPHGGEFVAVNGPFHERVADGAWQFGFRVEPRHANSVGICHGGMMATFCDMLLPIGAVRAVEALHDLFLPTISLQVDYLAPARIGQWVQGQTQVLRTTRSLVFAQGLVSADGEPVARVSGVFKVGGRMPPHDTM